MSTPPLPYRPFVAKALSWLAVAYVLSRRLAEQQFGIIVLSVLVLAIPITLAGAYSSTINQVRRLSYFKEGGWVHAVLSRRFFGTLLWLAWALLTSFVMLLQFSTYSGLEWLALAASIPVFWVVYSRIYGKLSKELKKPYVLTSFAIGWTRRIAPFVMLVIYLGLVWACDSAESYESLTAALAARRAGVIEGGGSAVVEVVLRMITFADSSKAYVGGRFGEFSRFIPLVFAATGAYVVFFNAMATFACLAIAPREYRRILGPLTEDDIPAPLGPGRVVLTAALITLVALFVYVPIFAQIEQSARQHPQFGEMEKKVEKYVEQIDKDYYSPGTIEKIRVETDGLFAKFNVSRTKLEALVDLAFERMAGNVDGYLDWYYSLSAEYTRLAKVLTGDIEGYMEKELSEYLEKGNPSGEIKRAVDQAISTRRGALEDYQLRVKAILDNNRIAADGGRQIVSSYVSLNDVLAMPIHTDMVAINPRIGGSVVAAGLGAVVAGKVVSKTFFKVAAKALAKPVATKLGTVATDLAIGSALGSFAPGVGTVLGGAIGVVIGLVTGVASDAALLNLEEAVSREDFKKEILESIAQAKGELKAKLFSEQRAP